MNDHKERLEACQRLLDWMTEQSDNLRAVREAEESK